MKIAAIWAQDVNGALGDGKGMCWSVPADFKHFKASTMGNPIIMGRASYQALGKALPGRENIVITRQKDYVVEDAHVTYTVEESLELAKKLAEKNGAETIWITGGSQIYEQCMQYCDELVVTFLDIEVKEPTLVYAPKILETEWEEDLTRSDKQWREASGDAKRWKIKYFVRKK